MSRTLTRKRAWKHRWTFGNVLVLVIMAVMILIVLTTG